MTKSIQIGETTSMDASMGKDFGTYMNASTCTDLGTSKGTDIGTSAGASACV